MAGQKNMGMLKKIIIGFAAVLIIAGVIWVLRGKIMPNQVVDSSKYQAVFLTNGQTYFGKVTNEKREYVNLNSVYYMILKQPLQSQNNAESSQNAAQPEYSLVKLGKELHGPTSMSISRAQILFIENLSDDSKVVTAIKGQK